MEIDKEDLKREIFSLIDENKINKIIVSNPLSKNNKFKKIVIENKLNHYLECAITEKQSFSKNLSTKEIKDKIFLYKNEFKQYNFFTNEFEYMIKISKKEKMFLTKTKTEKELTIANSSNNRMKNYILKEGEIIPPLIDMGVYTKDGKIINSMYDKYRQINRFIELVDDYIKKSDIKKINIIDFGCGKSYLTFVVYYYFKTIKNIDVNIIGLDLKEDVIKKCNETAKKYGYKNLKFELGDINGYKPRFDTDMIITLHACDTATDYALYNAIKWNVKMIFSVPCCQHEINSQIESKNLPIITRYGLIKERISSDFTDIIRCNLLKVMGYNVDMIEFIGFEHTPKNILIRANLTKIPLSVRKKYLKEVVDLKTFFNFEQTLYNLLRNSFENINKC
ncbi:MAG: SAM-dependent methyltransferase [Clostridia bacterium]|nr:SAM-dependent methyltransferase [Clostridia bacterium]